MLSLRRLLSALTFAVASSAAMAGPVYTSSAAFLTQVAPGSYTETFTGLDIDSSPSFSGGGFSYTASAPQDIFFNGSFLSTSQIGEDLTITFTSGNVTAFGGNFFATNISDAFQSRSLTLSLSDGTVETFLASALGNSYRGFTSNVAITSLVISGTTGVSLYAGLDNFTVGAAVTPVPEPGTFALMALGLVGLRFVRRRAA